MADEDIVTVTNNENPPINLEIVTYKNIVDINFLQSIESVISAHNTSEDSHENMKAEMALKASTESVNASLATKANVSTTYTKTETDTLLADKINTSDTTVTKQGNTFNSANQLVRLNSSGQLPSLDGSLVTGLANTMLSNIYVSGALNNLGFMGQSLNTNGYYKFPNSLIIQWGNSLTRSEINLPITFPNAKLHTHAIHNGGSIVNIVSNSTYSSSTTKVYFLDSNSSAVSIYWFAIGY